MNNDVCNELKDLLPAYVIGATTEAEAARVRALLPQCPDVAAEMATYAQIAAGLTTQVEPVAPPPDLRARLLAQAERTPATTAPTLEVPAVRNPRRTLPLGWLAAAALFVLLMGTNLFWATRPDAAPAPLDTQLVDLLADPDTQQLPLRNADDTPLATVLWTPGDDAALLVSNQLAPLDPAQTYQLWFIGDDAVVSGGVFQVPDDQRALVPVNADPATFATLAISVEPAPGSEAPTTDPVAVGSIDT